MTARFPHDFWSAPSVRAAIRRSCEPNPSSTATRRLVDDAAHTEPAAPHITGAEAADSVLTRVAAAGKSLSLFIPEHYEPRYAYPLIVWLNAHAAGEPELSKIMPLVSTRNSFGLAVTAPPLGDDLPGDGRCDAEQLSTLAGELAAAVRLIGRSYNVHTERVYLAGFESGGTAALQLVLHRPEWFAGAALLAGRLPAVGDLRGRIDRVRGKRVLMTVGVRDTVCAPKSVLQSARLLHTAGADVSLKVCDAGHEVTPKMLSHLNGWLMDGVCQPVA